MSIFRSFVLGAAVVALSACGGDPEPGVLVDGERLPVVDLHLHTGNWAGSPPRFQERITERVPKGFKWTGKFLTNYWLSAGHILSQMDSAGISAAGVFAVYSPHTTGIATNEFLAEIIAENPARLFGFASIRLDQWNVDSEEQLAAFEKFLSTNEHTIGVKLANAHQQHRFDDPRYYRIYEIAGRFNKPIYLHTATSPNPGTRTEPPYTDPYYLEDAIKRYPNTVFILGHAGWDSYRRKLTYADAAIDLALRYDNVYMEPGALGAERAAEVLPDFVRRIKNRGAVHKLIYGSDGPQIPGYIRKHLNNYVTAMVDAGYTKDEMRMIFSGNFSRVFGMPEFEL